MAVDHELAFGAWIKRLRSQLDLTQERLAELVGCAVQTIRAFERESRRPSREMAERLTTIFQLDAIERARFLRLARGGGPALADADHAPATSPPRKIARLRLVPPVELIGRAAEQAELLRYLRGPGRRLVTLVGAGGIGKTSLALHVAAAIAADPEPAFGDGVAVALLAAVARADDVPLVIADALGMSIQGARPVADQLLDGLRERVLLLVLDNLEHLLGADDGQALAALLGRMLAEAPGVRLLATSRERLRVRDEWVIELAGLALPTADSGPRVEQADAVRLFVERAQRIAPGFSLSAESRAAVARICRRLEGMPLAIELAAAWVQVLTLQEIASEIDRALDFLAHRDRDIPARHRSIRAALDHSWQLLTADERRSLAQLSVFHGGAERDAAAAIVHPTHNDAAAPAQHAKLITHLAGLIDKSLLRREEQSSITRYSLHELVRQYAAEQLASDPDEQTATRARHTAYYAGLLQRAIDPQTGASTSAGRASLDRNIDNIRAAWLRAAEIADIAALSSMIRGLRILYDNHGWLLDGAALFGQAADALRAADDTVAPIRGLILGLQGYFLVRAGNYQAGQRLLEAGLALQDDGPVEGLNELLYSFGITQLRRSKIAEAHEHFTQVVALAQSSGDHLRQHWASFYLGLIAQFRGQYQAATAAYQTALAIWQGQSYARGQAFALAYLGEAARLSGQREHAAALLAESMRISSAIRDSLALGIAMIHLGALAHDRGEWDEAHYLLTEAATMMREIGDTWLLGHALSALGRVALAHNDTGEALRTYAEMLAQIRKGETGLVANLLYGLALLLARADARPEALALLITWAAYPADQEHARHAGDLRAELERLLTPAQRAVASEWAQQRSLLPWLDEILARLHSERTSTPPLAATAAQPPLVSADGLYIAETGATLSPREIEVLQLLIAGAGNQAIAATLIISPHTVKHHVASILSKLDVASRTQAALRGRELGLRPPTAGH